MKSRSLSLSAVPLLAACVVAGYSSMTHAQIVLQAPAAPTAPAPQLIVPSTEKQPASAPTQTPAAPTVVPASAAKPEPIKVPDAKPKKSEDQPTTIDADESALDPKTGVHIFKGNVVVHSPQFDLTTDGTLEVHMKQDKPKPAEAASTAAKPGPPPPAVSTPPASVNPGALPGNQVAKPKVLPPGATVPAAAKGNAKGAPTKAGSDAKKPADEDSTTSDIESADARGKMVNVQKKGVDGRIKAGVGRHIIYNGITGVITLKEWPQVQDGPNLIIATEESTVMVLDQNNHLDVHGKSVTKLMPENDPNKKPAGAPAAPAPKPPAAPVKPSPAK